MLTDAACSFSELLLKKSKAISEMKAMIDEMPLLNNSRR